MALFGNRNRSLVHKPSTEKDYVSSQALERSTQEMYKLVSQLRDANQTREYKYAEYDIMASDVIIDTALNMYADDSTQVDESTGKVLSISSKDSNLKSDLEALLRKLEIEERLRDTAYALGKYGNQYWKVYLNNEGSDIDHLEEIDDPGCVMDLHYQGEPLYFAENLEDRTLTKGASQFTLYDHDAFIHFMTNSDTTCDTIELTDSEHFDSNGDPVIIKYKIKEGRSLIESVRVVWRILRSLEDSVIAAKLAKADYVRLYNIEVGESSVPDTKIMINKVKKIFDGQVSIDLRNGSYSATKRGRAWADPIFNATTNGTGAISVDAIGGDFEVNSLADLEYFNNQLFAGLRIPKTLMGFEESLAGGLSNESTLVQLDIRYSKYVKKIIDAEVRGVEDLCAFWLKLKGREKEIRNFKIVYNAPSSTEELAKLEELSKRVEVVRTLTETISESSSGVNRAELMEVLLEEFVPYPVFIEKVSNILNPAVNDSNLDIKVLKATKERQLKQLKSGNVPELSDVYSEEESGNDLGLDLFDEESVADSD